MAKVNKFTCDICKKEIEYTSDVTTGYGVNKDNQKVCYACCADQDKKDMLQNGKITLYLVTNQETGCYNVTNWANSLSFKVNNCRVGRHNIAGKRYDVWFTFNNQNWHGVTYGDNTQICHCKRIA